MQCEIRCFAFEVRIPVSPPNRWRDLSTKKKKQKETRTGLPPIAFGSVGITPTALPEGRGDAVAASPASRLPHGLIHKNFQTARNTRLTPEYQVIVEREGGSNGKASPYLAGCKVWLFPKTSPVGRSVALGGRVLMVYRVPGCIHGPFAPLSPGCSFRLSVPIWKIPAVSAIGKVHQPGGFRWLGKSLEARPT